MFVIHLSHLGKAVAKSKRDSSGNVGQIFSTSQIYTLRAVEVGSTTRETSYQHWQTLEERKAGGLGALSLHANNRQSALLPEQSQVNNQHSSWK